jgi:hypothetical protein
VIHRGAGPAAKMGNFPPTKKFFKNFPPRAWERTGRFCTSGDTSHTMFSHSIKHSGIGDRKREEKTEITRIYLSNK